MTTFLLIDVSCPCLPLSSAAKKQCYNFGENKNIIYNTNADGYKKKYIKQKQRVDLTRVLEHLNIKHESTLHNEKILNFTKKENRHTN